jgi:hypothetical protein
MVVQYITVACTAYLLRCAWGLVAVAWLSGNLVLAQIEPGRNFDHPFMLDHYFVSGAVLDDGSFALAGTAIVPAAGADGATAQFEVQAFSRFGRPLGTPFVAAPIGGEGGIGALGDRYFVTWRHTASESTFATLLSRTGAVLTAPFAWPNSAAAFYEQYYRYGATPAHAFLQVTYRDSGQTLFGHPILTPTVEAHDASARPLGHPARIGGFLQAVGIDGGGRFVAVEELCPAAASSPAQCGRGVQLFSPGGKAEGALIQDGVPQEVGDDGLLNSEAIVAVAPDGEFLLLWLADVFSDHSTIRGRLFDPYGAPVSEPFSPLHPENQTFAGVSALGMSKGRFLLSWEVGTADEVANIYIYALGRCGLSQPLIIHNIFTDGFVVATNAAGLGMVAWTAIDQQTNAHSGRISLFTAE